MNSMFDDHHYHIKAFSCKYTVNFSCKYAVNCAKVHNKRLCLTSRLDNWKQKGAVRQEENSCWIITSKSFTEQPNKIAFT